MNKLNKINFCLFASCTVGLVLSCYALFVELKTEENKEYKAYCDINEYISCTKAFSSKYGKGFGIVGSLLGEDSLFNQPNSLGGVFCYILMGLISWSHKKTALTVLTGLSIASVFLSLYLAYILYFILHDFCMVCVLTYFVNAVNLALCTVKWKLIKSDKQSSWKQLNKNK